MNAYTKCGSRIDGRDVFEKMGLRDIITWTIMMASYAQVGSSEESSTLYKRMVQEGFEPDRVTFLTIIKASAIQGDLCQGMHIHSLSIWRKIMSLSTGNSLIDMYVKCGSIEHAWKVFDTMPNKDGVSWNVMIGGFASLGHSEEAFSFFINMEKEGFNPDQVTFLAVLKACSTIKQGKQIHAHIRRNGLMITTFIGNTLIDLYIKCESLVNARQVFDEMYERDTLSFTMLITGYCKLRAMQEPIVLFQRMFQESMFPNEFTFVNTLNACLIFEHGNKLHVYYRESHFSPNIVVENTIIDMYAKCGSLTNAQLVFDQMIERDIISWNTLISGYASHEHGEEAFVLFWRLEQTHLYPDCATYLSVLKACNCVGLIEYGYVVHSHIVERSFGMDVFLESSLVDMYAKCGSIKDAHQIFNTMALHDVVAWNTIMAGYVQCGHSEEAFQLFRDMERKGLRADASSVLSLLKACVYTGSLEQGRHIHALTIEDGLEMHLYLSVSFIDLYAKSGNKEDAFKVFNMMTDHDTVAWNAIITGYSEREYSEEALRLYDKMQLEECCADTFTFVGVLKACATVAMIDKGRDIHTTILKKGLEINTYVECTLVDMYGKCGSFEDAYLVFKRASHIDVVLQNAMIAAYASYGLPKEAMDIYQHMNLQNLAVDFVTSVNILSACSHAGLILEGYDHFKSIHNPTVDHYVCVVDLLGRAGLLHEALKFIQHSPIQPCPVIWTALLGACKAFGNLELGHFVAKSALELDLSDVTILQLCSLYYQQDDESCLWGKTVHLIESTTWGSNLRLEGV